MNQGASIETKTNDLSSGDENKICLFRHKHAIRFTNIKVWSIVTDDIYHILF